MSKPYIRVKRLLDVLGSIVCLILFSPFILATALAVKINLGSPVLFKQERPGLNEHVYTLYKFRSMKQVDKSKGLISDASRLGKFGKVLRSTSLDELPSLWNVLKGDMSFVGPRPLLVEYLSIYSQDQKRRHAVRPGITGLAQVSGRNALSWENKFKLDVFYVDQMSMNLDSKILWKTLLVTIGMKDINAPGDVTVEKFTGSHSEKPHPKQS